MGPATLTRIFFLLAIAIQVTIDVRDLHGQSQIYTKLASPLTIADLGDLRPLKGVAFVGPHGTPQSDGSRLIASDVGKGVISHIWMTVDHGVPDTATQVIVVIDGDTAIKTSLRGVGRLRDGYLRPPFDTTMSGGTVCDVLMPYTESFQVYYTGPYLFCAIMWRPHEQASDLGSFMEEPYRYADEQIQAEQSYWKKESPWLGLKADSASGEWTLAAGDTWTIASASGPSFIHTLEFFKRMPWSEYHDSLHLQIYWDDNIRPHIDQPLNDLFGLGGGETDVNAFQLRASADRVLSYMPMPFSRSAKVVLVNRSSRDLTIAGRVLWSELDTAGKQYGVLSTTFNYAAPTKHEVDHLLVEQLGRGRYIGCHLNVPKAPYLYYLEGDYKFRVDGAAGRYWQYTGTEDYFNAAWYFEDSIFSLPFAGCTILPVSYYRFHYLDAVDFSSSFDLRGEHGNWSGIKADYRSTSFCYVEPQRVWTLADTIVRGQSLSIEGKGLATGSLDVRLNESIIGSAAVDDQGDLEASFVVHLAPGNYRLSVGEEVYNRWVVVLEQPYIAIDTSRHVGAFNYQDTLLIVGRGFDPLEELSLFVDTFSLNSTVRADSRGEFKATALVPYMPSFTRPVRAVGASGSVSLFGNYEWSRTFTFEAEDLKGYHKPEDSYMGWWGHKWSHDAVAFTYSGDPDRVFDLQFDISASDTYRLELHHNTNIRFGDYDVYIDDVKLGTLRGFSQHDYNDPQRSERILFDSAYVSEGWHVLRFHGVGRHAQAVENSLAIDNFWLVPVTEFRPRSEVDTSRVEGNWVIHPSPLRGREFFVSYTGTKPLGSPTQMTLLDAIGRIISTSMDFEYIATAGGHALKASLPSEYAPGPYFVRLTPGPTLKLIVVE